MIVEQIIYTATDKDLKHDLHGGYAVVAKTTGITKEILEFLEMYHYPIGILHTEVLLEKRYKSFLKFKEWLIYSTCITVRFSHDGRSGTLYTQHLVFKKEDFKQINNDTRHLDGFFTELPHTVRDEDLIKFVIPYTSDNKLLKSDIPYNEKIIAALQKKKKVALLSKWTVDMQELLALMEPQDRVIPWTNIMFKPMTQWHFRFVCGDSYLEYKLHEDKSKWLCFEMDPD